MKHRLVKQLSAENKKLKAEIRGLKNRKPICSNPIAEFIAKPTDVEALKKHFERNKYAA